MSSPQRIPVLPKTHVRLPGSNRKLHPGSRPIGKIDPSDSARIVVRVRARHSVRALASYVEKQYSVSHAERVYLSHKEMEARHGALPEDLELLEKFAARHGLHTLRQDAGQRTIVFGGTLKDIQKVFPADLGIFAYSGGTFRGRQGEIFVPRSLAHIITGVFGHDTRPKQKHGVARAAGPGRFRGQSPEYFAKRYHFPAMHKGVKLDGAGQCVAVIELGGGFILEDLQRYFRTIGVRLPRIEEISVDRAQAHTSKHGFAEGEVTLDLEVLGAVVPKAKLAVYFAPNDAAGLLDAMNTAIHDHKRRPGAISISWGWPEGYVELQERIAFHEMFYEAAALGITVCAAAGDHGAAGLGFPAWDGDLHPIHPAADDLVLACGGTQIDRHGRDIVWNDGTPFSFAPGGGGWAGGGGISRHVPVPRYQQKARVPVSVATGKPGRGVPDIAMSATNYYTRIRGIEGAYGGTSAVAPLMAALVARLNQAKKKYVGFLNPFLYANDHLGITKDITVGTNVIANSAPGYRAKKGWDPCTGLGTPNGKRILRYL